MPIKDCIQCGAFYNGPFNFEAEEGAASDRDTLLDGYAGRRESAQS